MLRLDNVPQAKVHTKVHNNYNAPYEKQDTLKD